MRVLGLDVSLTATGYSCPSCGNGIIKSEALDKGAPTTARFGRFEKIAAKVNAHVDHPSMGVDLVMIEGYSFGAKGNALLNLAELGGILRMQWHRGGVRFLEIPPATLKLFATGKGNAGKDEMIAAAIRRFGFEGHNNNEADAFMLREFAMYRYHVGDREDVPANHRKAFDKIDWPTREEMAA